MLINKQRYDIIEDKELSDMMLNKRFYSIIDTWNNNRLIKLKGSDDDNYDYEYDPKAVIASTHYLEIVEKCYWLNKDNDLYFEAVIDYVAPQ